MLNYSPHSQSHPTAYQCALNWTFLRCHGDQAPLESTDRFNRPVPTRAKCASFSGEAARRPDGVKLCAHAHRTADREGQSRGSASKEGGQRESFQ